MSKGSFTLVGLLFALDVSQSVGHGGMVATIAEQAKGFDNVRGDVDAGRVQQFPEIGERDLR